MRKQLFAKNPELSFLFDASLISGIYQDSPNS